MTTEDQKLTNESVKPADDPRKHSVNAKRALYRDGDNPTLYNY